MNQLPLPMPARSRLNSLGLSSSPGLVLSRLQAEYDLEAYFVYLWCIKSYGRRYSCRTAAARAIEVKELMSEHDSGGSVCAFCLASYLFRPRLSRGHRKTGLNPPLPHRYSPALKAIRASRAGRSLSRGPPANNRTRRSRQGPSLLGVQSTSRKSSPSGFWASCLTIAR